MNSLKKLCALLAGGLSLMSTVAFGNERHFTQTYESATLPQGEKELELWFTPRWDRDDYAYRRLDTRAEIEWGVLDRLQTSLYVNFNAIGYMTPMQPEFEFSVSNEWKLRLLDAVADPVGLSLYAELTGGFHVAELEGKVIVDKQIGNLLIAFNAVAEYEWLFDAGEVERELEAQGVLGVAYLIPLGGATHLGVGVETHADVTIASDAGYESTAFFAGPTLSLATRGFWVSASFMPQLGSHKSAAFATDYPGPLELHDHERYTARLLFGIHF